MQIIPSISELEHATTRLRHDLVSAVENGREEAFLKDAANKLLEMDEASLECLLGGLSALPIDERLFKIVSTAHGTVVNARLTAERYHAQPGFGRF